MEVEKSDIFGKFYEEDIRIDMEAVKDIVKKDNPMKVSNYIIERFPNEEKIETKHVDTVMRMIVEEEDEGKEDEKTIMEELSKAQEKDDYETCLLSKEEQEPIPEVERKDLEYEILKDISGESTSEGNIRDFVNLFESRLEKLHEILEETKGKVANVSDIYKGKDIRLGGLVSEVNSPSKDAKLKKIIEIEDKTGTIEIGFHKEYTDDEVLDKLDRVVEDEYLCVEGSVTSEGDFIFGNEIFFPNTPTMRKSNSSKRSRKALFITDTHFGSSLFSHDKWKNFVNWVRKEGDIDYMFVSGDLVEGVGIYPGQLSELDIPDIKEQYKICSEAFGQLPENIRIFASVGNHDMVRLGEPQPKIDGENAEFFKENVTLVGSPCLIDVEGVKVLMYHGNSLNQVDESIPDVTIKKPEKVQKELLIKRHMAPVYGGGTRIAPEKEDYMVIEEVPDIFQAGHTHTLGMTTHNKTRIINPGCWVGQTLFQKKKNIDPDIGYAYYCDLSNIQDTFSIKKF